MGLFKGNTSFNRLIDFSKTIIKDNNMYQAFYGCTNFDQLISIPHGITSIKEICCLCNNFDSPLYYEGSSFDTITDMSGAFYRCSNYGVKSYKKFLIPSSVKNMSNSFSFCDNVGVNIDIVFNSVVNAVEDMSYSFQSCYNLKYFLYDNQYYMDGRQEKISYPEDKILRLPNSVVNLDGTFCDCNNFMSTSYYSSIYIPDNVIHMNRTFQNSCYGDNLFLPKNVKYLNNCFYDASPKYADGSVINLISLEKIEDMSNCFRKSFLLKSLGKNEVTKDFTFPPINIANYAFYGCDLTHLQEKINFQSLKINCGTYMFSNALFGSKQSDIILKIDYETQLKDFFNSANFSSVSTVNVIKSYDDKKLSANNIFKNTYFDKKVNFNLEGNNIDFVNEFYESKFNNSTNFNFNGNNINFTSGFVSSNFNNYANFNFSMNDSIIDTFFYNTYFSNFVNFYFYGNNFSLNRGFSFATFNKLSHLKFSFNYGSGSHEKIFYNTTFVDKGYIDLLEIDTGVFSFAIRDKFTNCKNAIIGLPLNATEFLDFYDDSFKEVNTICMTPIQKDKVLNNGGAKQITTHDGLTVIEEPTCTSYGTTRVECSICHGTGIMKTPMLDHEKDELGYCKICGFPATSFEQIYTEVKTLYDNLLAYSIKQINEITDEEFSFTPYPDIDPSQDAKAQSEKIREDYLYLRDEIIRAELKEIEGGV